MVERKTSQLRLGSRWLTQGVVAAVAITAACLVRWSSSSGQHRARAVCPHVAGTTFPPGQACMEIIVIVIVIAKSANYGNTRVKQINLCETRL